MTDDSSKHIPNKTTAQELEETLLKSASEDSRLSSGVQPLPGNGDLTFISMSGLAETVSEELEAIDRGTPEIQYNDAEMDPHAPLSFYEKGIDDVDVRMDPENIADTNTSPVPPPTNVREAASASLAELENIIAELSEAIVEKPILSAHDLTDIPLDEPAPVEPVAKDLMAQSLEAASVALDDLSSPINTNFAENIADAIAVNDDAPAPRTTPTPNPDIGYSLEEAESLLNELEAQDKDDPLPQNPEPVAIPAQSIPPLSEIAPLAHADMDFEELLNTLASDTVESTLEEEHELLVADHKSENPIGLFRVLLYLLLLIGLIVSGVYSYTQYMNTTYSPQVTPSSDEPAPLRIKEEL